MGDFITGVLVENRDGATYEGVVYDRFLKLRHLAGQVLSIFDPFGPISTRLETGKTYEMILVTLPVSITYFPTYPYPPTVEGDQWQGTVIDARWRASEGSYQFARPDLYSHEWVLLATPLGQLLMHPEEVEIPVDVGGMIQWKNVRLDLRAVV